MKRYIAILLFVVALPIAAMAQVRTSYFMEGSTFRTDMNPALAPTRGYVNFPMLGGVSLGVNNNFLSIENMLYPTKEGLVTFMHKSVDRNDFLKRLPRNNTLQLSLSEQLVGFGAHTKRFFWSFGMNVRMDVSANIPKQFFSLVTSLGQGEYSMKNMSLGLNTYMETYLGAAIPIKEIATVGFRVKGLVGMVHASLDVNNTMINVTDESVSARLAGELRGCAPMAKALIPEGEEVDVDEMLSNIGKVGIGGMTNGGVAFDLGAEVRLLDDHLRVSAAVTDLGFISWNKNATVSAKMGGAFAYNGFDLQTGEVDLNKEDITFEGVDSPKGYLQRMNCSINVGAEYTILNNRISFGLLSHTKFCQMFNYSELTASVNFKPLRWLTATVSHTLLNKNQPGVFGFALNLHPAGFNLFLGADFIDLKFAPMTAASGNRMLLPVRQRSVNLNMGLGFSLGRAKYSKAYKDDVAAGRVKVRGEK
ncbi:MAG: hypothetical protein J6Q20_01350 [Alistipes sp.]|nr:hypothetical protein [Alistipes sp.]